MNYVDEIMQSKHGELIKDIDEQTANRMMAENSQV